MNKDFFEKASKMDWTMEDCDRRLDSEKVSAYLNELCEPYKTVIGTILKETIYVPFKELYINLIKSLNKFKQYIGNKLFYLVLDYKCIKSEHWMVTLLWNELKDMNFKIISSKTNIKLTGNVQVEMLLIDDALYSGCNMASVIDNVVYNSSMVSNKKLSEINSQIHWSVVVSHTALTAEQTVGKYNTTIYKEIIVKDYGDLFIKYKLSDLEMAEKFDIQSLSIPALYFDHKVAENMSTFTSIYLRGIIPKHKIPTEHNRESINIINDNWESRNLYQKIGCDNKECCKGDLPGKYFGSLFSQEPSRHQINSLDNFYKKYIYDIYVR